MRIIRSIQYLTVFPDVLHDIFLTKVVTIDNLTNSRSGALKRVQDITGKSVTFYQCDMLDAAALEAVFAKVNIKTSSCSVPS